MLRKQTFHAMIEQALDLPFETAVLGVTVSVKRGGERPAIPILALPLPDPPPSGWEWIEANRRWARGR